MTDFAKPPAAEEFLELFNSAMRAGEDALTASLPLAPSKPTFIIVGPPRSGTTMLLQLLAQSSAISAPTNLLARFYGAPYLGGLVQRLITDPSLAYRQELAVGSSPGNEYRSVIGKTEGLVSPHEFFYFWRQYFPVGLPSRLSEQQWRESDSAGFVQGIARIEAALGAALAMKGIILQYNLVELANLLPKAIFLVTRREEVANVESLLNARRTANSEHDWFSVQPPGWEALLALSPLEQVCGQVAWTNDDLAGQVERISAERVVRVDYEALCADTDAVWQKLAVAAEKQGMILSEPCPANAFTATVRPSQRRDTILQLLDDARANRPGDSGAR